MTDVWTKLRDGTQAAKSALWDAANVETVRLAVTGLSGAGKTNFLVSVISNILAMTRGDGNTKFDSLPKLRDLLTDESGQCRLLGVEIEPAGATTVPRFPYEAFRDELALGTSPKWPDSTKKASLVTLRLLIQPRSRLGRIKGAALGPRVLRLELLDYPGEWLVDLPLLNQSFEDWSAETLSRLKSTPRLAMAADFLNFLGSLSAQAPAVEAVATFGFELYSAALTRFRKDAGLRWLQPGRFLMPGAWNDAPFLHFFPWTGAPNPGRGTLGALLRDRFELYKQEIRKDFFDPHFRAFTRQVFLVDVLAALLAGQTAFDDVCTALGSIGSSFAKLQGTGWPFGGNIEQVAFVATKSDHVDDLQRDNLGLTLQAMVGAAQGAAKLSSHRTFHVVSSIRCTTDDDYVPLDGPPKRVVMGVPLGQTQQKPFSAGSVPAGVVPPAFFKRPYLEVPVLRPPAFQGGDAFPIENINLDRLLVQLLGDVL